MTNKRIIHVDWKKLTQRNEAAAEHEDIQEIWTKEKGIFSAVPILDYGLFRLETASKNMAILFEDAPDPEGIKKYIYDLKPS